MATSQGDSSRKAIISVTPRDVGTPQPVWNRKIFDDAIEHKGYNAFVERSLKCPCVVKGSKQALTNCCNCGGSSWIFINKFKTRLLCSQMANRNKYEVWTQENMGTVNITARPQDRIGFMDRITLSDLETMFTQNVDLKRSKQDDFFSFLNYEPITVFDAYYFAGPHEPLIYLNPETDFVIEKNKIKIIDVAGIELCEVKNPSITLRYTHNPTYYVIDINRDVIKQQSGQDCNTLEEHTENFPMNCIGRRAHFVLDEPNFDGDRLFDNTNYDRALINYDYK